MSIFSVPELSAFGENYWQWSVEMRGLLDLHDVWDVVSMGVWKPEPEAVDAFPVTTPRSSTESSAESDERVHPAKVMNRPKVYDARASTLIMSSCSPRMLNEVLHASSAKDRWDIPRETCLHQGKYHKDKDLFHTVLKADSDLTDLQMEIEFYSPEDRISDDVKLVVFCRALRRADSRLSPLISHMEVSHEPDWTYSRSLEVLKNIAFTVENFTAKSSQQQPSQLIEMIEPSLKAVCLLPISPYAQLAIRTNLTTIVTPSCILTMPQLASHFNCDKMIWLRPAPSAGDELPEEEVRPHEPASPQEEAEINGSQKCQPMVLGCDDVGQSGNVRAYDTPGDGAPPRLWWNEYNYYQAFHKISLFDAVFHSVAMIVPCTLSEQITQSLKSPPAGCVEFIIMFLQSTHMLSSGPKISKTIYRAVDIVSFTIIPQFTAAEECTRDAAFHGMISLTRKL
ncbi:hypothetical protein F5884DRAFT_856982 [Xylogone sp. PMI_703]|nr:hypothetical protein F5884DRAFT_856982 [Xylogone sp. PMI_703]